MKLRAADDGHNVYVLYSDLLFNLVILFLVIVLALVLRMHATMQAVASAQAPAEASAAAADSKAARDRIAALELTLSRDRAGVDAIRAMVATAQDQQAVAETAARQSAAEVESLRAAVARAEATARDARQQAQAQQRSTMAAVAQQLAIAAGANRFTGRSGSTSMSVALDLSGPVPSFVPLSASAFDSAGSRLDAETPDEHKVRAARLLHEAIDGKTRFTAAQLHGLFEALDVAPAARADSGNREGTLLFTYGGPATLVASGWEGRDGDVNEAAIPARTLENFDDITRQQIDQLIGLRDQLRPDRQPPSTPVLHFSAASGPGQELQVGHARYSPADFRQIVSSFGQGGIILQYDPAAGEAAPDWVTREVLTPTGYTNAVPDPTELQRLRRALAGPDK